MAAVGTGTRQGRILTALLWTGVAVCLLNLAWLFPQAQARTDFSEAVSDDASPPLADDRQILDRISERCGTVGRLYKGCLATRQVLIETTDALNTADRRLILIEMGVTASVMLLLIAGAVTVDRQQRLREE